MLEACSALRLDRYQLSDALFQAAAVVHHAAYRHDLPNVDPDYIRQEIESRARLADYFSRDIVDEAQKESGPQAGWARFFSSKIESCRGTAVTWQGKEA